MTHVIHTSNVAVSPSMPDNPERRLVRSGLEQKTTGAVVDIFTKSSSRTRVYESLIVFAPLAALAAPLVFRSLSCDQPMDCLLELTFRVMVFSVSVLVTVYIALPS